MRTYIECFPSIKRFLLDPLQPDVFIHTWSDVGVANQPKRLLPSIFLRFSEKHPSFKRHVQRFVGSHDAKRLKSELTINRTHIESLYNPKDFVIEDFPENGHWSLFGTNIPNELEDRVIELDKTTDNNYMVWRGILGGLPMFYKIYACNEMVRDWQKSNNFVYDLVVRIRPDIEITDMIPATNVKSIAYIGFSTTKNPREYTTENRVSDQFFWGTPDLMDIVSEIWLHLEEYYSDMAKDPSYSIFGGERVLALHCKRKNIDLFPYNIHSRIVRERRNYFEIVKTIYRTLSPFS